MIIFARRGGVSFSNLQGRRGMVFIKPGGVFAGSAGYFLKWAGFRLDIGWVSQLMETQLAILCNSKIIEIYNDRLRIS